MPSHTPGPWNTNQAAIEQSIPMGRYIATAYSNGANDYEEDLANARLIAQAPELLAQLEAAEQLLSASESQALHTGNLALMGAINERLYGIRAAIQKAKG